MDIAQFIGRKKGKKGLVITVRDPNANKSQSLTLNGIDLKNAFQETYIFWQLRSKDFNIMVEKNGENS